MDKPLKFTEANRGQVLLENNIWGRNLYSKSGPIFYLSHTQNLFHHYCTFVWSHEISDLQISRTPSNGNNSTIPVEWYFTVIAIAIQFNSKLMTPVLGSHPSPICLPSSCHQHDQLMICPPLPLLFIQQYTSCMPFVCVSNYYFPSETTIVCR